MGDARENALDKIEERVKTPEEKMAKKNTEFAVINTKLSAILWELGIVGTAVIGVLVKLVFKV